MSRLHLALLWLVGLVVGHSALLVLYAMAGSARGAWRAEDGLVEWLSVGGFVLSAVAALWLGRQPGRRLAALLIGGLGILGALDELSFGSRLIGFEPPVVAGVSLDAVHDLVEIGVVLLRRSLPKAVLVAMLLVAVAITAVVVWRRRDALLRALRAGGPLFYAAMIVPLAIPAVAIDLHLVGDDRHAVFLEEVLESAAAWTWVCAALALGTRPAAACAGDPAAGTRAPAAEGPQALR